MTAHKYEKITRRENNAEGEREKEWGERQNFVIYTTSAFIKMINAFLKSFNLKCINYL